MGSNASSGGMGNVCVIYKKIEINVGDKSEAAILDSLNEMLHTEKGLSIYKYKNNYTSCIYLEGNYVKSHEMAIYLRDNALRNIMIWKKITVFSRLQILFLPRLNMPQKRRRVSLKN